MKWKFGQDVDSKEILGMEPTELKEKLDNAVSKTDLTSFKDELLASVKESLKSIEIKTAPIQQREPERQQQERTSFLEDEDKAFNERAMPLAAANAITQSELLKLTVLADKPYYKALKKEVDTLLAAQPLSARANPAVVENCYKIVCADNLADIQAGKIKSSFQVESATNSGGNVIDDKKKDDLSQDELKAALSFGIDPNKYKETKGKLKFVV